MTELIRVWINPARGFANKGEHDKATTKIANEIIKVIEKHGFKLANFIHFDTVDCARPSGKSGGEMIEMS